MPRATMKEIDIQARLYKLKTKLFEGHHQDKSGEWHDGAHFAYNEILNLLQEYKD